MSVKEFLRPSKGKILSSLLLLGIIIILIWLLHFLHSSNLAQNGIIFAVILVPFRWIFLLFYNSFFLIDNLLRFNFFSLKTIVLTILFSIILLILTYVFGCYVNTSKKIIKGLIFYLVAFLLVFTGIFILIEAVYNPLFGLSCNIDSDCSSDCGYLGTVNSKYIRLNNPYSRESITCVRYEGICENNRCEWYKEESVSVEYCERRESKSFCYFDLAKKLSDTNFCDKVENEDPKKLCIKEVGEMNRLRKEFEIEYAKLDKHCETNEDCVLKFLGCLKEDDCINKNADISKARKLGEAYDDISFLRCPPKPLECKCTDNTCTTIEL